MKNIKDYLPFYLGCQISDGSDDNFIVCHSLDGFFLSYIMNNKGFAHFKLVLRRFSDMNEQELLEQEAICDPFVADFDVTHEMRKNSLEKIKSKGINAIVFDEDNNPLMVFELVRYYLSKHFDLFGLIDEGLAIDKATLNVSTTQL